MKNSLIVLIACLLVAACNLADKKSDANAATTTTVRTSSENNPSTPAVDSANLTTIQWIDSMDLNMGKIAEGQKLEVSYRFKNTGTKPLVISKVWAQCGCTVPETPKEPFAPGQEGTIKAVFNSENRGGSHNTKEVYVSANTNPVTTVLVFHVEVLKKSK